MDCKNFAALLESSCSVPLCCETLENTNLFVYPCWEYTVLLAWHVDAHIYRERWGERQIAGGRGRERGSWFVNS